MNHLLLRNPIPRSPSEGGGGGDTVAAGGGGDTVAAGGGGDTVAAGGSGDNPPWYAGLPDDLKGQQIVLRHKDLPDAITSLVAAEKRLGVPANQLVRLPANAEDTAAVQAIYKALGAPETAEGYKIDLAGATDADKAVVGEFAKHMHEKGPFPPAALSAAAEFWHGKVKAQDEADLAAAKAATEAGDAALKTEFGPAYAQKVKEIGALIKEMGGDALAKELNETNLGDSPELAKLLAKVVDMRAESGPSGDGPNADVGGRQMTPGQARVALAELEGDEAKRKALMDGSHPQHKAMVDLRQKLLLAANPSHAPASA